MNRILIGLSLMAALALPAVAAGKPSKTDKREGAKECRQLQAAAVTRANFVQIVKLEAKANKKSAFGRCVKVRSADAAGERNDAFKQAKAACASLKPGSGGQHGKPSDPGAYGHCVAAAARQHGKEADSEQADEALNPAKTCRKEQAADADAFKAKYPGANGFGKCVSQQAKANKQQDEQQQPESGTES